MFTICNTSITVGISRLVIDTLIVNNVTFIIIDGIQGEVHANDNEDDVIQGGVHDYNEDNGNQGEVHENYDEADGIQGGVHENYEDDGNQRGVHENYNNYNGDDGNQGGVQENYEDDGNQEGLFSGQANLTASEPQDISQVPSLGGDGWEEEEEYDEAYFDEYGLDNGEGEGVEDGAEEFPQGDNSATGEIDDQYDGADDILADVEVTVTGETEISVIDTGIETASGLNGNCALFSSVNSTTPNNQNLDRKSVV